MRSRHSRKLRPVRLACAAAGLAAALAVGSEVRAQAPGGLTDRRPAAASATAPFPEAPGTAGLPGAAAAAVPAASPGPRSARPDPRVAARAPDARDARDARVAGRAPWALRRVRAAQQALLRRLPPSARGTAREAIQTLDATPGLLLALLAAAAGLVWLTARLLRGRGDLAVSLEYPAELRGTFDVRVLRGHAKPRRPEPPPSAEEARKRASRPGAATRSRHPLVTRETRFRELPSGAYHVVVEGFVEDPLSGEILATHREQQSVRLRRGQTVRAAYDFHPKHCAVDVRVAWDRRPVPDAWVTLHGVPEPPLATRGRPLRLQVGVGSHRLVVGSRDRVAEAPLEVKSFRPLSLEVDLAHRSRLLFSGCPLAVEPYLHGDVPAAARALEREGQTRTANALLARACEERGQSEAAARHYEAAGRPVEAAKLREALSHFAQAAALYEQARDPARAAAMYEAAGDPGAAGDAWMRARDPARAAECFQAGGDVGRWIDALEAAGEPCAAARVALDHGQAARAARVLQEVPLADPRYLTSARLLAEVYQEQGQIDMAERKLEEILAAEGEEKAPLELCDRLSQLMEHAGEYERALDLLHLIERRSTGVGFPNLATRIEALKKRRSHERELARASAATRVSGFDHEQRYEILEEIGRGGMGVVYRATDRRLGRVVALKRLPESLQNHPKAVELFLREARSAAALNHPNIVTVFDAGREADAYYIAMELLQGRPLTAILQARGRLSPRDAAKLVGQVAAGLDFAHGQKIIHRDIKTANLFFTRSRTLKIMDFGLAKMMEEVRRATTVIGGTPYYMAPEQSLGGTAGPSADLYALGVTLFELVTGRLPFPDGDVAYHHRHTPPPDPRGIVPGLPDEMAELVLQLLAKEPGERPASAAEVGERLRAFRRNDA